MENRERGHVCHVAPVIILNLRYAVLVEVRNRCQEVNWGKRESGGPNCAPRSTSRGLGSRYRGGMYSDVTVGRHCWREEAGETGVSSSRRPSSEGGSAQDPTIRGSNTRRRLLAPSNVVSIILVCHPLCPSPSKQTHVSLPSSTFLSSFASPSTFM